MGSEQKTVVRNSVGGKYCFRIHLKLSILVPQERNPQKKAMRELPAQGFTNGERVHYRQATSSVLNVDALFWPVHDKGGLNISVKDVSLLHMFNLPNKYMCLVFGPCMWYVHIFVFTAVVSITYLLVLALITKPEQVSCLRFVYGAQVT